MAPEHPPWEQACGRVRDIGTEGEAIAAIHLTGHGCTIVARNLHVGSDEIDLVVRDGDAVAAVEVKTSGNGDDPLSAVDEAKFGRLARAAAAAPMRVTRLDLVGVSVSRSGLSVRWLVGVR